MLPPSKLEKQILATIIYYDIISYPLTGLEIFSCLISDNGENEQNEIEEYRKSSLRDILDLLDNSDFLRKNISRKLGFYFLTGREEIVYERLYRKKIADRKWKKAKKILWIMQVTPFIKALFVSGSLALGNCKKSSDIDVLIVAKKGRIWTVRVFATILTALLGARRHGNITKDRICLNYYITDKSLKIPFASLYDAQSYSHLINAYSSVPDKEIYKEFQKENMWMKNYVQNYDFHALGSSRSISRNKLFVHLSIFFEFIFSGKGGDYFEKKFSEIQTVKIKNNPSYNQKGGRITISDDQLEFHPELHEKKIMPEFYRRMRELGLFDFANQRESGEVK